MAKKKSEAKPHEKLLANRDNGYSKAKKGDRNKADKYCAEYLDFLSAAKTEREAHDAARSMAVAAGYRDLDVLPAKKGALKPGNKVFRSCRGKTLLLAHIGEQPLEDGLKIIGGHIDSPRLDSKPVPLYEDGEMAWLDTRYYGGVRKYQWVAMPLAIHGVFVREDGTSVKIAVGEREEDPVFAISDLLPHLAKEQNKKPLSEGIHGENLNVLVGSRPVDDKDVKEAVKASILQILHDEHGIEEEDFVSAELEIVPAGRARDLGFDRSLMLGYGHDDRICSYAGLRAILDLDQTPGRTVVVLLCDKEEIGSVGATGMESTFFENTVAELAARTAGEAEILIRRALERSKMISADVTPAHDPNYADVSSPNGNMAVINHGVAVAKYTGSGGKSRSSEASAEFVAEIRSVFNGAGVVWQTGELGKVDQGGGGTIAMFLAKYGMDVIDCGAPLLSMHAPWRWVPNSTSN
jgi:aspartyl aminopeptidase